MRFLNQGLCLAVAGAGLVVAPTVQAQAADTAAAAPDRGIVARMKATADGDGVLLSREPATGAAGFVRARSGGDLLPGRAADDTQSTIAKAESWVDEFAPVFGAPSAELDRDGVSKDAVGTTVDFTQTYRGVPVFGSLLRVHLDTDGDLTSVNGFAAPDVRLDTTPAVAKAPAGARAVQAVAADPPTDLNGAPAATDGLEAAQTDLVVYRTGLTRGEPGENVLAWIVEVTNGSSVRDQVVLDAATGKPLNRWSMVHDDLERQLYEADEERNLTLVYEEGDPLPGDLNADQESIVRSAGDAYWFFANAFGRDSYDDEGAPMITINNDPAIECPNANWNGQTTNYCDGVSSDDVVAHEWGHAYTEYTHGLIYQWQPGALNEAYSDMWGETIDLINGRLDEGEGDLEAVRPVGQCSTHSPALPLLTINAPSDIAKDCLTGGASFGEQLTAEGITGDVVTPTDAVEEGGTATDGCSAYEQDVTGQIVLVDRGLCPFTQKAQVATDEGAAALIIGNSDDSPISMSGDDPSLVATVSIGLTDRELIRSSVADGDTVNVTMKDAAGERVDSFRWLVGEKSGAFGGAIRDMWNPTCYGDPGKVSDAEYKCSTDDSGGVHGNSGVPNHGYALLVDGGTSNGVDVQGIGLDKAAAIYYRAMTSYQTPASDFADHADSLGAACADLTGQPINQLTTEADATPEPAEPVTAGDCASVESMAAAIELRKEPVQCNFQPLLARGSYSPCGEDFATEALFEEDFEDGLGDWEVTHVLPYYDGDGSLDWTATDEVPGNHDGGVAFAIDPDAGTCAADGGDITGSTQLTSPAMSWSPGQQSPRLSFSHYVATESGFDGGNVKMSINGSDFAPVPDDAYLFNGPNLTLEPGQVQGQPYNTNPLAGERGFSGTDGGEVTGSWGQSVIDVSRAGAVRGDEVRFQFDSGRDGCGGIDGWYVDDVSFEVCLPEAVLSTPAKPAYAQFGRGGKVTVDVAAPGASDTDPTGYVTLKKGNRWLGTSAVSDGSATVDLPPALPLGTYDVTVLYSGDDVFPAATTTTPVRVVKGRVTLSAAARPSSPRAGRPFTMKVDLDGGQIDPYGVVRVFSGGRQVGHGYAKRGTAFVRVQGRPAGARRFGVVFTGTKNFAPAVRKVWVRIG